MALKSHGLFAVFISILFFGVQDGSCSSLEQLTLAQAKAYAVDNNHEIDAARKELEEYRAKSSKTNAAFLPTVGVAAGLESGPNNNPNNQRTTLGYLYGNYNIFRGFEDSRKSKIAELQEEKIAIHLSNLEFKIGLEVESVFNRYIYSRVARNLKKEAIDLNNTHRITAMKRKRSGLVSTSDVMEFDIYDSLLRSELLSIEQELSNERIELKRLLGEEIGGRVEPVGQLQHQHLTGELNEYVSRIKTGGRRVLLARRELAVAGEESKMWRSKWIPQLDVQVQAGYLPLGDKPPNGNAAVSAMVLTKVDLFSGFETMNEKRETQMRLLKMEARLKQAILSSVTDAEKSYREILTIQARVDLEIANAQKTKKYYDSVLSEYRRGIKNSLDLKGASERYYIALLRQEEFKLKFLARRIELEKVLGGPVQVENVDLGQSL